MTTSYEEARAALEEALRASDEIAMPEVYCTREMARALLAGPPEPSEEEVRLTIRSVIGGHIIDGRQAELAARVVQQLYRSRRHG